MKATIDNVIGVSERDIDIDNDNEASKRSYDIDIDKVKIRDRSTEVRSFARYLAAKFNDQAGLSFYLKCAWHLPRPFVVNLIESSTKRAVKCPKRYFTAVAARELRKLGY